MAAITVQEKRGLGLSIRKIGAPILARWVPGGGFIAQFVDVLVLSYLPDLDGRVLLWSSPNEDDGEARWA